MLALKSRVHKWQVSKKGQLKLHKETLSVSLELPGQDICWCHSYLFSSDFLKGTDALHCTPSTWQDSLLRIGRACFCLTKCLQHCYIRSLYGKHTESVLYNSKDWGWQSCTFLSSCLISLQNNQENCSKAWITNWINQFPIQESMQEEISYAATLLWQNSKCSYVGVKTKNMGWSLVQDCLLSTTKINNK